jgi:hypothetical protein
MSVQDVALRRCSSCAMDEPKQRLVHKSTDPEAGSHGNQQVPKEPDGAVFSTMCGKDKPGGRWGLWVGRPRWPERLHLGQSKTKAQRPFPSGPRPDCWISGR